MEIGALPEGDSPQIGQSNNQQNFQKNRLGITVSELTGQQRSYGDGVLVQNVTSGGAGALSGIVRGDVIAQIYGEPIRSVADFNRVVESLPKGRSVPMRIVRRGAVMFIPLRVID